MNAKTLLSLITLAGFSFNAQATHGTLTLSQSPEQAALVGGGSAAPQNSSWLSLNPASALKLDRQLTASYDLWFVDRATTPAGGVANTSDGRLDDKGQIHVPNFSFVSPIDEKSAWGIGLFGTTGLASHYPHARSAPGEAGGYDRKIDFMRLRLSVVYARDLGDGWSIGLGPNISYSRLRTDMMLASGAPNGANYDWDESWGAGFQVGLMKEWEDVTLSVAYTSRQWTQTFNEYDDIATSPIDDPQQVQVGIAWRATETFTLTADYLWINWEDVRLAGTAPSKGGFGYEDQHIFKIGAIWEVQEGTTLYAGVSHGNGAVSDRDAFANVLTPVIIKTHAGIGVRQTINEHCDISLGYYHAFHNSLSDNGNELGALSRGTKLAVSADVFSLGITWKF